MLLENCPLLGTDNVCGQISEHIFIPIGGYWLYIPQVTLTSFESLHFPFRPSVFIPTKYFEQTSNINSHRIVFKTLKSLKRDLLERATLHKNI